MRHPPPFTYAFPKGVAVKIENGYVAKIRNILRHKDIILYYNPQSNRMVLSEIVKRAEGIYPEELSDLHSWDAIGEDYPDPDVIWSRCQYKHDQLSNLQQAMQDARNRKRQEEIEKREARKDFGRHMKRKLATQGVHNDPGVEEWIKGTRGFVPTDEDSREQYDHIKRVLSTGTKPSVMVNGTKGTKNASE
jgi:hypothetical protein